MKKLVMFILLSNIFSLITLVVNNFNLNSEIKLTEIDMIPLWVLFPIFTIIGVCLYFYSNGIKNAFHILFEN